MIKNLIQQIREGLNQTDEVSVLADWDHELSSEFAFMASELAEIKRQRATRELAIKAELLQTEGKYTEKEIERRYFSEQDGQNYAYYTEMLKAVGKLISAIRFKRKMLTEPL